MPKISSSFSPPFNNGEGTPFSPLVRRIAILTPSAEFSPPPQKNLLPPPIPFSSHRLDHPFLLLSIVRRATDPLSHNQQSNARSLTAATCMADSRFPPLQGIFTFPPFPPFPIRNEIPSLLFPAKAKRNDIFGTIFLYLPQPRSPFRPTNPPKKGERPFLLPFSLPSLLLLSSPAVYFYFNGQSRRENRMPLLSPPSFPHVRT